MLPERFFSENGFHSASMKAICKSCAISRDALSPFHLQRSLDSGDYLTGPRRGALARFREPIEGFISLTIWSSLLSLTHEAFGQQALVVEIMAEGMRNPQVAAMQNKHMTIAEFVAQRMRDAQQKAR